MDRTRIGAWARAQAALALVAIAGLTACGDAPTAVPAAAVLPPAESQTGRIAILVSSTDTAACSGHYAVTLDHGTPRPVDATGAVVFDGVLGGVHELALTGFPEPPAARCAG